MPATIGELLEGKPAPITARPSETVSDALARMITHNFSQLPVVDGNQRVVAIVTADSIVRALNNFETTPRKLRVVDVMCGGFAGCGQDDDLLDKLDALQRNSALLVKDQQGCLVGILTSQDATDFFRRRARDIMLVQDIEETIKEFVLAAFSGLDDPMLTAAIEDVTPSNRKELRPPFVKALRRYLELSSGAEASLSDKFVTQAFEECLYRKESAKPFDRLTLDHYNKMLVHESRWAQYEKGFGLGKDALTRLLESVRSTRNDLAHFRGISEEQREKLQFCKDWLTWHADDVLAAVRGPEKVAEPPTPAPDPEVDSPMSEDTSAAGSRYERLSAWLEEQPRDVVHVSASLDEIEQIIGSKLPASAREYRSWWSNNLKGHTQSKQWLEAGWRVASVSFRKNRLAFVRDDELGDKYREFFEKLHAMVLAAGPSFAVKMNLPQGYYWMTIGQLPESGNRVAFLNFSFTRDRQFRVELYIDTGGKEENKRLFDSLYLRRVQIEADVGESLVWERIEQRRASRVAIYRRGSITDRPQDLENLRAESRDLMLRFGRVMKEQVGREMNEKVDG